MRSRVSLRLAAFALALWVCALTSIAFAQTPGTPPPAGQWATELDGLVHWVEAQRGAHRCTERCFTLQRLHLSGSIEPGPIQFELEGAVLADGPVTVPLFGPPDHVRVENVTEDGRPAAVGFEENHYFAQTSSRHFVLRGSITLLNELTLTIPGPLNSFDADLTGARVAEGSRLSGLSNATLHFDRGTVQSNTTAGPTVFQLSHSVRVGREVTFTWRLALQSGTDLGVVRLPLRYGERVLDVNGATGWRVEGQELLLPTAGRQAEVTITGSLASLGDFSTDTRSDYEWWLIEGDPEHRLEITTDARQMDASESPIPRTQPSARLFLVQRAQRLSVRVQTLVSMEALAAVVHAHDRRVVLTRRADLVADDSLSYENNGVDYLPLSPDGRPVFLSTDGTAERIMHRAQNAREIQVPLRTGRHVARVQSISRTGIGLLGGRMEIPTPEQPLTASHVSLTLGLPRHVIPLAFFGGDHPVWAFDGTDLAAFVAAVLAAWIAFRTRLRRVLGAASLAGLWLVSPALFVVGLVVAAVAALFWLLGRLFRGNALLGARFAAGIMSVFLSLCAMAVTASMRSRPSDVQVTGLEASDEEGRMGNRNNEGGSGRYATRGPSSIVNPQQIGNLFGGNDNNGAALMAGVTPVAVTLPGYDHSVCARRELVTPQRPFRPVLYYITGWALLPVGLLWLLCIALLARSHRAELTAWVEQLRERIARGPESPVAPNA